MKRRSPRLSPRGHNGASSQENSGIHRSCLVEKKEYLKNLVSADPTWHWALCDACNKWRRLSRPLKQTKSDWFCSMNKDDPERARCSAPEEPFDDSIEEVIHKRKFRAREATSVAGPEAKRAKKRAEDGKSVSSCLVERPIGRRSNRLSLNNNHAADNGTVRDVVQDSSLSAELGAGSSSTQASDKSSQTETMCETCYSLDSNLLTKKSIDTIATSQCESLVTLPSTARQEHPLIGAANRHQSSEGHLNTTEQSLPDICDIDAGHDDTITSKRRRSSSNESERQNNQPVSLADKGSFLASSGKFIENLIGVATAKIAAFTGTPVKLSSPETIFDVASDVADNKEVRHSRSWGYVDGTDCTIDAAYRAKRTSQVSNHIFQASDFPLCQRNSDSSTRSKAASDVAGHQFQSMYSRPTWKMPKKKGWFRGNEVDDMEQRSSEGPLIPASIDFRSDPQYLTSPDSVNALGEAISSTDMCSTSSNYPTKSNLATNYYTRHGGQDNLDETLLFVADEEATPDTTSHSAPKAAGGESCAGITIDLDVVDSEDTVSGDTLHTTARNAGDDARRAKDMSSLDSSDDGDVFLDNNEMKSNTAFEDSCDSVENSYDYSCEYSSCHSKAVSATDSESSLSNETLSSDENTAGRIGDQSEKHHVNDELRQRTKMDPNIVSLHQYNLRKTALKSSPPNVLDECHVFWRKLFDLHHSSDFSEETIPTVVWARRPRKSKKSLCKWNELAAKDIEYYVHFQEGDCRLDRWVTFDCIDSSTILRKSLWQRRGDDKNDILVKRIEKVIIGRWEIPAWYDSLFPQKYMCDTLYYCQHCLAHTESNSIFCKHIWTCQHRCPPGEEVYREGDIMVFEVDGKSDKEYCQRLCRLGKLFINHKTICYDVQRFRFYVLTKVDEQGAEFVGYFSKEINSPEGFNVACIMILPPFQTEGYGKFLISLSYELSRRENTKGSPEKPLSSLGEQAYMNFWKYSVASAFAGQHRRWGMTVAQVSDIAGMTREDVNSTVHALGGTIDGKDRIHLEREVTTSIIESSKRIRLIKPECLNWHTHRGTARGVKGGINKLSRFANGYHGLKAGNTTGCDGIVYTLSSKAKHRSHRVDTPGMVDSSVSLPWTNEMKGLSNSTSTKQDISSFEHLRCLVGDDIPEVDNDDDYSFEGSLDDNESTLEEEESLPRDICWSEELILLTFLGDKDLLPDEQLCKLMNIPDKVSQAVKPMEKVAIRCGDTVLQVPREEGVFDPVEADALLEKKTGITPETLGEKLYLLLQDFYSQVAAGSCEDALRIADRGFSVAQIEEVMSRKVALFQRRILKSHDSEFLDNPLISKNCEATIRSTLRKYEAAERDPTSILEDDRVTKDSSHDRTLSFVPIMRRLPANHMIPRENLDYDVWKTRNTYCQLRRLQSSLSFLLWDEAAASEAQRRMFTYKFVKERLPRLTDKGKHRDKEDALKLLIANKEHTIRSIGIDEWRKIFPES